MMLGFLSQREMWAPVVGWHKGASFRWLIEHPSLPPACGFGAWGIKEKFNKRFFLVCGLNNWICGISTPVSSLFSSFSLPFRPAFWSGCPVWTHLTRESTMGAETKSGTSLAVWARLYTCAFGLGRGWDFLSYPRWNMCRKVGTNHVLLFSPIRVPTLKAERMEAE